MKKRTVSFFLTLAMLLGLLPQVCLLPASAAASATATWEGFTYTTYTWDDLEEIKTIPYGKSESGKPILGAQGFGVSSEWLYLVSTDGVDDADRIAEVNRYNLDTGVTQLMHHYSSLTATTPSDFMLGHCNDSAIVRNSKDNSEYFFAAVMVSGYSLERLKIGGADPNGMYLTGYFDLTTSKGGSLAISCLSYFGETADDFVFLVGNGSDVYSCVIPKTAPGGTRSNPTRITCYRTCYIDWGNATFVNFGMVGGNDQNLESLCGQGFDYQPQEKLLYRVISDFQKNATNHSDAKEYVFTYNLSDLTVEQLVNQRQDWYDVRYCTGLDFAFVKPDGKYVELENVGFRTGGSSDGRMYIVADVKDNYAHIYRTKSYNHGTTVTTLPPVNTGRHTYTVSYDPNGGTNTSGDWRSDLGSTRHIHGITTNLRNMRYTRPGYHFTGWNLTRNSANSHLFWKKNDHTIQKWMPADQADSTWEPAVYANEQAVSALDADGAEQDENLVVTCHAVWEEGNPERWIRIEDGVYRIRSYVDSTLYLTAGSAANGSSLYYKTNNPTLQRFVIQAYGDNRYTIRLQGTNLYLTADGCQCRNPNDPTDDNYRQQVYSSTSPNPNKNVKLVDCGTQSYSQLSDKQKWYFLQEYGELRLENVYTGLYLYVVGGQDVPDAIMGQWHLNKSYPNNRFFQLIPDNDFKAGIYEFYTKNAVSYRWSGDAEKIQLQSKNDSVSQRFRATHLGDGWYSLQNM